MAPVSGACVMSISYCLQKMSYCLIILLSLDGGGMAQWYRFGFGRHNRPNI